MGLGMFVKVENKYSQGARLRDLEKVSDAGSDYDKMGGMCLNLSILWLIGSNENDPAASLAGLGTTEINGRMISKLVANNQKAYASGNAGAGMQEIKTISKIINMLQRNAPKLGILRQEAFNNNDIIQNVQHAFNMADAVLIIFNCRGGAHAVGAFKKGGNCYLFDPNYGMMISLGDETADRFHGFLDAMVTVYGITDGTAYGLSPGA